MNVEERAQGLLNLVETYRTEECREVIDRARAEAGEILRRAWRAERAHLHASVEAERSRARALIQAARAERATRERTSGDRRNARLLALAWPRLGKLLQGRWQDPQGREDWVAHALASALDSLPAGQWTLRHAPDWSAHKQAAPCVAAAGQLAKRGAPAPTFRADPGLDAGLVVECGAARLDASLAGLLQDRLRLEARLLALLATKDGGHAGDAGAGPGKATRDGGGRAGPGAAAEDARPESLLHSGHVPHPGEPGAGPGQAADSAAAEGREGAQARHPHDQGQP
jgi:hypothetical protein